ncbi:MAG: hypothetical protein HRF49_11485 [bacterium]|jgi:hypothetical protein
MRLPPPRYFFFAAGFAAFFAAGLAAGFAGIFFSAGFLQQGMANLQNRK